VSGWRPGPPAPAAASASLNAARRARDLDRLAGGEVVDLLVVGGGVTGAGVALDAATRGLRVALVERGDLAQGTSRWSSKLVHGGLRYLAHGEVGLAYESAAERRVLMTRVAPHLVRPLPMLTPLTPAVPASTAATVAAALWSGDVLARAARTRPGLVPGPRRVRAVEARRLAPALAADGLRGGLLHWEGQLEDDARLVVALARTAAAHGATVLTSCEVLSVTGAGARVRDVDTGETTEVRARAVVNATGVWADGLDPHVRLRPSKGSHLVVRAASLGHPSAALNLPVAGEHTRFVLVLPQPDGLCYVGLTDEPHSGPVPDRAEVSQAERAFLLDVLGQALDRPLDASDVVGSFAGFRPLLDSMSSGGADSPARARRTADLSRRHAVHRGESGVVTVTGGKLTTYRRMARDAVDLVTDQRCRTAHIPLVGAGRVDRATAVTVPARLVRRFGSEASAVAALADDDPGLAAPLAPGVPVLGVEIAWALRHEGARTVEDLLDRRTRLGLVPTDADAARPAVERIVAGEVDAPGSGSVSRGRATAPDRG